MAKNVNEEYPGKQTIAKAPTTEELKESPVFLIARLSKEEDKTLKESKGKELSETLTARSK